VHDVAASVCGTVSETDVLDFSGGFLSFSCEGGGWLALDPVTRRSSASSGLEEREGEGGRTIP
jgi:hypothetical protein